MVSVVVVLVLLGSEVLLNPHGSVVVVVLRDGCQLALSSLSIS